MNNAPSGEARSQGISETSTIRVPRNSRNLLAEAVAAPAEVEEMSMESLATREGGAAGAAIRSRSAPDGPPVWAGFPIPVQEESADKAKIAVAHVKKVGFMPVTGRSPAILLLTSPYCGAINLSYLRLNCYRKEHTRWWGN